MGKYVLQLEKYEIKTKYTIVFEGNCTSCSKRVRIKYYGGGMEILSDSPVLEVRKEELEEMLNRDYGYGEFQENIVAEIFENHHRYEFK